MNPEQVDQSSRLFEEALSLPEDELAEFLDRECCGDTQVRAEVERLLGVQRSMSQNFLETPASGWLNPTQLKAGDRIWRYEIERPLGSGGMSVVYRARDLKIGRAVAVKLLLPTGGEIESSSSFVSELRVLGALQLENVVRVYDCGEFQGMPFIVMECLEGEDLAKAIKNNRCGDFQERIAISRQLATVLREVHAAKIIHRDIKPANVFLQPNGRIKLMDFGMAREARGLSEAVSALIGTPEFISPEQIKGQVATFQSDIYSFGILLFELFSRKKPFNGETLHVLHQAISEPLPTRMLADAGVPRGLIAFVAKAAEKNPKKRFSDFNEVLEALDEACAPPVKRRSQFVTVATLACLAVVAYFFRPVSTNTKIQPAGEPTITATAPQLTEVSKTANPITEKQRLPARTPEKAPAQAAAKLSVDLEKKPEHQIQQTIVPPFLTPPPVFPDTPTDSLPAIKTEAIAIGPPQQEMPNPAPKSAVAADPYEASRREVAAQLEAYASAWRNKDIRRIAEIFPRGPIRDIRLVFANASVIDYRLAVINVAIQFSDASTAMVRCQRFSMIKYPDQSVPREVSEMVTIRMTRGSGNWQILSID